MTTIDLIVVGASLGGVAALEAILAGLPREFSIPIVVVQHRGADSADTGLVDHLSRPGRLSVVEAQDKMPLSPGFVILAPADYHVLIDEGGIALSVDPPINYARPSIDVLFESAADALRDRVAGLVLTGANADGAVGLCEIKRAGGLTLVQSPETAVCRAMPDAALAASAVDRVLALSEIAAFLVELDRGSRS